MKKLLTLLFVLTSLSGLAQTDSLALENELEFDKRLKHISTDEELQKMEEVVLDKEAELGDMSHHNPSITSSDDLSKMHKQIKKYKYDQDIETVWKVMGSVSPKEAFAGPKVHFAKAYSPSEGRTYNREDNDVPKFEKGMSVINYLTLPPGLRLAVGVTVVRVDREKRELEIAYTQGNTSTGVQILTFSSNKKGKTIVTHISYFRSQQWLRDMIAYKPFHSMTVGEYHKTMKRILNEKYPVKK